MREVHHASRFAARIPSSSRGKAGTPRNNISTADPDPGDQLRISAPDLPRWLSLTDRGDGTALLIGTATMANVGEYPITLLVADPAGFTNCMPYDF
jgi:hypothetical protein